MPIEINGQYCRRGSRGLGEGIETESNTNLRGSFLALGVDLVVGDAGLREV